MSLIRIQLKGMKELHRRFDAIDDLGPIMRDLALTAIGEQKRMSPVKTGNLRRSIHLGRVTDRSAETIAGADYAAHVEFGTRPHEIRPRNRRVLRWKGKGNSYIYARRVQHPGTRAQPYMIPGAEKAILSVGLQEKVVDKWNRAA